MQGLKHEITSAEYRGTINGLVLLVTFFPDLSKFFDIVPQSILLEELPICGISWFMVLWMKNWLKDRAQRVLVNGATSI